MEIFIFCYDYKHPPFSKEPYQPKMNFSRPLNVIPWTVACNSVT